MKTYKRTLVFVVAMAALAAAGAGHARQLGNGGTTYSGLLSQPRPEEFLGRFVDLARADVAANSTLLQALGAKLASAAPLALDMQASTADITHATVTAGALHEQVSQLLATPIALSEANKAAFASGAAALTLAARDMTALTKNIGATKQALVTAGAPARVALHAARATPDLATQLRAEVKAVLAFANANAITLAPEVIEAAAAM
ncbi:hypothetical protein [Massilia sp. DWR3-1-1]|uniref:hypothetical protein n=1 Tax=Massilia sp. DWR3-1-1 TaxID=2804559 RepID=UPI003CEA7EB8